MNSLTDMLVAPWRRPAGATGRFAGWEMSRGKTRTNTLVATSLDVREDDRILEVGYGPGVTIEHLAHAEGVGFVAGVDPSDVMLCQAARRNRNAIMAGRVDLRLACAESLPFPGDHFTKALTLNSIGFWDSADDGLRELRRVLCAGGRLVVGVRDRTRAARVSESMRGAGFADVETVAELDSIALLRGLA